MLTRGIPAKCGGPSDVHPVKSHASSQVRNVTVIVGAVCLVHIKFSRFEHLRTTFSWTLFLTCATVPPTMRSRVKFYEFWFRRRDRMKEAKTCQFFFPSETHRDVRIEGAVQPRNWTVGSPVLFSSFHHERFFLFLCSLYFASVTETRKALTSCWWSS